MEASASSSLLLVNLVLLMIAVGPPLSAAAAAVSDVRPPPETSNLTCHPTDLLALNGFRNCIELTIGNWGAPDSGCCSWSGVTCGYPGGGDGVQVRVLGLDLSGRRLKGRLCDPLAYLDRLVLLNLSGNQLGGALLPRIFRMQSLEVLDLSRNQFSGYFPVVTDMPAIRVLDVSYNLLVGQVTMTICNSSSKLVSLNMAGNAFHGEFPPNIGNCGSLQNLSLQENYLSGYLPESLFMLRNLRYLLLRGNSISGTLSNGVGNLSSLVELDISRNFFWGELPDCFASTPKLEHFFAGSNRFSGSLPYSLENSRSIKMLVLNNNTFEGGVNINCSAMPHLAVLNLGSNSLKGEIPGNLSSCRKLQSLNLSRNNISGTIPLGFRQLQELSALFLSTTRVHDLHSALQTLQHCKSLSVMILSLSFRNEQMPGEGSFLFQNLSAFAIGNSQLTGTLPVWLSGSRNLRLLDLSWNRLNGDIPQWIGDFKLIFYLALANNSFSGDIPEGLTRLPSFIDHKVSSLGPVSSIPLLLGNGNGRFLQYNQYWNLPTTLELSYNKLVGPIWPSFGNLKSLQDLFLEHNHLSGELPDSLGGMTSLEKLRLSHNELSGKIPISLSRLTFLSALDLSYNKLSGMIPTGGQFSTFRDSCFEGNDGLWGEPLLKPCRVPLKTHSPSEDHDPQTKSSDEDFMILATMAVAGGAYGFIVTVGYCFASGWATKT
ncbi:hypothetical protein MLD38_026932 [Melastoma candidum]|uniref:Uncharacterized protein n=1 Tax=Melastoma candidum TaxID=119954 RepID=A0ACB9P171_9MYRT|nr:hypothetical protein MLD38_026932 [Melastoma candidum]